MPNLESTIKAAIPRTALELIPWETRFRVRCLLGLSRPGPWCPPPPPDPAWQEPTEVSSRQFVFVGGLHRSGTSMFAKLLAEHPDVSGFLNTGAPEDEGQHLQDVLPVTHDCGGAPRVGRSPDMLLNEASALATPATRQRLLECWLPHWDLNRKVLVEKTPENLQRTRFLQALFPESVFLMLIRHPIAQVMALRNQHWHGASGMPVHELIEHWLVCYERLMSDLEFVERKMVVRYETLVEAPQEVVTNVWGFVGLQSHAVAADIRNGVNREYQSRWEQLLKSRRASWHDGGRLAGLEARVQRFGYSLKGHTNSSSSGLPGVLELSH